MYFTEELYFNYLRINNAWVLRETHYTGTNSGNTLYIIQQNKIANREKEKPRIYNTRFQIFFC